MNTTNAFPKTIYAIQHLAFEDLGSLEDVFYQLGFRVRYFEAGVDDLTAAFAHDGLTIILGGPIGVYETEDYPFLKDEIALLKQRLAGDKPTLGICLGAQLIAHALGAKVYAGHQKEIGWSPLSLSLRPNQVLSPLLNNVHVLHWHGDTFDLPENAALWLAQIFILIKPLKSVIIFLLYSFTLKRLKKILKNGLLVTPVSFAMLEFQFLNCASKISNMHLHLNKLHLK